MEHVWNARFWIKKRMTQNSIGSSQQEGGGVPPAPLLTWVINLEIDAFPKQKFDKTKLIKLFNFYFLTFKF